LPVHDELARYHPAAAVTLRLRDHVHQFELWPRERDGPVFGAKNGDLNFRFESEAARWLSIKNAIASHD
jgi:hypothetical protein